MSDTNNKRQKISNWQELAEGERRQESTTSASSEITEKESVMSHTPQTPQIPSELKVQLTHGVWFGTAMGIGFAIGFLISFLALAGFVGFVIFSRFPGLFN